MSKVGAPPLNKWRPSAKSACLVVVAFFVLSTGCLFGAIWEIQTWEVPSIQTRKWVEAEMRGCSLAGSQLPDGWRKGATVALPPHSKFPPPGALGSISIRFSHQSTNVGMHAFHKIQLYQTKLQAAYNYRITRIGYTSRWHPTWEPLDLKGANLSATEYRAACSEFVPDRGPSRGDKLCGVKARYGILISIFEAYVSPWDRPEEEFVQVLQAIDSRMLQCAESSADKKWKEE